MDIPEEVPGTLREYMVPRPNPLGTIKKIPKKLISLIMRLTRLDRILMEVFLATITVPDEKLQKFMRTRFERLVHQMAEPLKKASEEFGENIIVPLTNAIPGVPFIRMLDSIKKGGDALDEVQGEGAKAFQNVLEDFKEFYDGIEGPHRVNTSLMLGLGNYLSKLEEKVKRGETLTEEDLNQGKWLLEVGHDADKDPAKEDPRRAAARALVTSLAKEYMEKNPEGLTEKDKELVKQFEKSIEGFVENEMGNDEERGLFDRMLGIMGEIED